MYVFRIPRAILTKHCRLGGTNYQCTQYTTVIIVMILLLFKLLNNNCIMANKYIYTNNLVLICTLEINK
jgi:hypothetical protein